MAYADSKQSSSRIVAIIIVALIHAVLGYAFVTGLAYKIAKQTAQDLNVFDVEEEPPPPEEEPPPPPPDQPIEPPPVVSPPPIVRLPTPPPPIQFEQVIRPPTPPTVVAAPPPPPPPPARPAQAAKRAEQRGGSISDADYPPSAQRAGDAGSTTVRFTIGTDGKVSGCSVTRSSGSSTLDNETCKLITRRFRYRPAEDASGNKVTDTKTQTITWRLPKD